MKLILALSLGVVLGAAAQAAAGQTLPALPSGFLADSGYAQMQAKMRAAGVSDGVRGTKLNDNMSPCFSDPKIEFGYGWNLDPAGQIHDAQIAPGPRQQEPHRLSRRAGQQAGLQERRFGVAQADLAGHQRPHLQGLSGGLLHREKGCCIRSTFLPLLGRHGTLWRETDIFLLRLVDLCIEYSYEADLDGFRLA